MFIEDVALVRQSCTTVKVKFEDSAVADFFDQQIDLGRKPEQFARVWIHTHPGDSAQPSLTDERTFDRIFAHSDWGLMAILARGGASYTRLRLNGRVRADVRIPTEVCWSAPFASSDQQSWLDEYKASVNEEVPLMTTNSLHDAALEEWDDREVATGFW